MITRYRLLIWIAAAVLSFLAGTAAAQDRATLYASARPSVAPNTIEVFTQWTSTPALKRYAFRSPNSSRVYHLGPLAFEKERTAFLNQVRVPLTSFFGGRVQLACLHQRLRSVHMHSAVPVADAASSVYRSQSTGLIPSRTRATWGGGVWLHFSRPRA